MATSKPMPRKLWEPQTKQEHTPMGKFMREVNRKKGLDLKTYDELYNWSVETADTRSAFWEECLLQSTTIYTGTYTRVVDQTARMDSVPHWFEGIKLNFAENLLYCASPSEHSKRVTTGKEDSKVACTEIREGNTEVRSFTWGQLRANVGLLANAMRGHGVRKGDRVAVVASTSIDTLTVFLAITSLGGIFSSSSTDMGTKGVLDRLLQIKPRFVFVDDAAVYNGKKFDLRPKMAEIANGLKGVDEFSNIVSVPRYQGKPLDVASMLGALSLKDFLQAAGGESRLVFEETDFRDPFLIVYSSGTTGVPKCIVHSIGGVLVSNVKEGRLHRSLGPESTVLQYTTTGWIMYLASITCMQVGARSILYDGSPFQPDLTTFIKMVGEQKVTQLGVSPRFFQTLASAQPPVLPRDETDLSNLRVVTSTGMVLSDALFEWFYDKGFPAHVQLANISGGTDIAGCFASENPLEPVYSGGCQCRSLGLRVEAYDSLIEGGKGVRGRAVPLGEAGELVCTASFPNQPVMFWGDESGQKYWDAYYARFDDLWTHGDLVSIHPTTKGVEFHGRADGVLNPSGVRFGSAEIYNVLDAYFPNEIQDSICVGQRRPQDSDESVMLFLLLKEGQKFSEELVKNVKDRIAKECSRRHVPRYVFQTWEIPTTVNLKKVELPVKRIVSGEKVTPSGTLLNPESLKFYERFAKVEELVKPKARL